jgi:hypothetical protein
MHFLVAFPVSADLRLVHRLRPVPGLTGAMFCAPASTPSEVVPLCPLVRDDWLPLAGVGPGFRLDPFSGIVFEEYNATVILSTGATETLIPANEGIAFPWTPS